MKQEQAYKGKLRPFRLTKIYLFLAAVPAFVLSNTLFTHAQEKSMTGLSIGDTIPEKIWRQPLSVINHPEGRETITLNDYRGKLIILDFWATWCSPCIAMFPKTDSLQKKFAGKVQFLPVTYEDAKPVTQLFNGLSSLKGLSPTMVISDNSLRFMYPHRILPHYVWIGPDGSVIAITGMEEIKGITITRFLQSGELNLAEKKDTRIPFDENKPLFINGNGGDRKNIQYRAVFSGYVEGLPTKYTIFPPNEQRGWRILVTNLPLSKLYALAYGEGRRHFGTNTQALEVNDPSKLTSDKSGRAFRAWMKGGVYCYEISAPAGTKLLPFKMMQEDLKRFFPQYDARVEKRRKKCLLLIRTSGEDKLRSNGGKPEVAFSPVGCNLQNTYLNHLTVRLRAYYMQHLSTPIINDTGYRQKVDLKLSANLSNVEEVRKALAAYDLDLVEGYREVEVLVIRDRVAEISSLKQ